MTNGVVKLNLMVIGVLSVLISGGVAYLGLIHEGNAAAIVCSGDAMERAECGDVNGKGIDEVDSAQYAVLLQQSYGEGILYTGEVKKPAEKQTSLVPLPPALLLFGGALAGVLYLGRRRKVRPVQDN